MSRYYLRTTPSSFDKIASKLLEDPDVVMIDRSKHEILLRTSNHKKYSSIKGVKKLVELKIRPVPRSPRPKNASSSTRSTLQAHVFRRRIMFFDIDGTITPKGSQIVDRAMQSHFDDLANMGIWVYLATGRSSTNLSALLRDCRSVQKESIAENGGIILGFNVAGFIKFGDNKEPNKILNYVKRHYQTKEDMDQGLRITEVIFLKNDITEEKLLKAKNSTRAKISIHKSRNSFHISASGIDKGSAIQKLAELQSWIDPYIISVGDAQMDVPMFKQSDFSFAPSDSDPEAKENCSEVLPGSYADAMDDILKLLKKTPKSR